MKKIIFFIFSVIIISVLSCVGSEEIGSGYYITINGLKVQDTDTTYVRINQLVQMQIFDIQGNSFKGVFHSSNLQSPFGTGKSGSIKYEAIGVYKITVSLVCDNVILSTYIKVDPVLK